MSQLHFEFLTQPEVAFQKEKNYRDGFRRIRMFKKKFCSDRQA